MKAVLLEVACFGLAMGIGFAAGYQTAHDSVDPVIEAQQDTIRALKRFVIPRLQVDSAQAVRAVNLAKAHYDSITAERPVPHPKGHGGSQYVSQPANAVPLATGTDTTRARNPSPSTEPALPDSGEANQQACSAYITALRGIWGNCEQRAQAYYKLFQAAEKENAALKKENEHPLFNPALSGGFYVIGGQPTPEVDATISVGRVTALGGLELYGGKALALYGLSIRGWP